MEGRGRGGRGREKRWKKGQKVRGMERHVEDYFGNKILWKKN